MSYTPAGRRFTSLHGEPDDGCNRLVEGGSRTRSRTADPGRHDDLARDLLELRHPLGFRGHRGLYAAGEHGIEMLLVVDGDQVPAHLAQLGKQRFEFLANV